MSLDFYLYESVYWRNITHNLTPMWRKAGCYEALYHGEGNSAGTLVPTLDAAIASMKADPEGYRALEPANKWGTYEAALEFLEDVRSACRMHLEATIRVSK